MGHAGDLLLIFADALTRSWKQITKFRPAGAPEPAAHVAPASPPVFSEVAAAESPSFTSLEGLLRDERGIRLAPEVDD
jgi:cyanophycin synthetase